MSLGWKLFIFIITVGSLVAHLLLLVFTARFRPSEKPKEGDTTGHVWDEDLTEYNNPLPRWWLFLFHGTIVFTVVYLALYPGSAVYDGILNWTQERQYEQSVEQAEARYGKIFEAYAATDIKTLARNPDAMEAGFNLFGNNCAQCHGSDGRGAVGFPNLTDDAWLWGGDPAQIKQSVLNGRNGVMPPWRDALGGDEEVEKVAHYVLSLSGLEHDAAKAAGGAQKFGMFCVACHGPEGKGNPALGSPDLTDDAWLYEPTVQSISDTIANGRNNQMPAFGPLLGEDRIHVVAAYVYSLSADGE